MPATFLVLTFALWPLSIWLPLHWFCFGHQWPTVCKTLWLFFYPHLTCLLSIIQQGWQLCPRWLWWHHVLLNSYVLCQLRMLNTFLFFFFASFSCFIPALTGWRITDLGLGSSFCFCFLLTLCKAWNSIFSQCQSVCSLGLLWDFFKEISNCTHLECEPWHTLLPLIAMQPHSSPISPQ